MEIVSPDSSHRDEIRQIYRNAFGESEREAVAGLAIALLLGNSHPPSFARGAKMDGQLVGHVSFSPVHQKGKKTPVGWILAPLAVDPACQNQGIGSKLVRDGLSKLKDLGEGVVFVYGDPNFYQRFGFSHDAAENFNPPYPLEYPIGWLALAMGDSKLVKEPVTIECVDALCVPELW